jgi:hypothetical protein
MRKSLLYLATAVILGIAVTLAPLFAITLVRQNQHEPEGLIGGFRSLEKTSSSQGSSESYVLDLTIVTVSLVTALSLYVFVRRRVPRDFSKVRFPPC